MFYRCSSITSLNVEANNQKYLSIDGVLYSNDQTEIIKYPEAKEGVSYIIPNSVTNIKRNAFYGCSSLTNIEIPSSVTSIGESAFRGCIRLNDIIIP